MSEPQRLPPAEKTDIRLGFLKLADSAPLVMARELGYYARYGLEVSLQREVSWANVRDKLVTGDLDAAQMLAPLPLATSLGMGGLRADVITGLALSLNGNAITLSPQLAQQIEASGAPPGSPAGITARALAACLARSGQQITLASAHTFSCHTFLLRHWLHAGGLDPDSSARVIVLPPEQMVDSLARGLIDGFCVGEPWSTMAVEYGVGTVQATGYDVWNNGMEKVLGVTEQWHQTHVGTHLRLRLALMEACAWLAEPDHRREAAHVLAGPAYLDMSVDYLLPSLSGRFRYSSGGAIHALPHFHVFGRFQAGFPWRSDAEWLLQQSAELLGKRLSEHDVKVIVQRTFRTDLYREACRHLSLPCPSGDYRPLDQHDGDWEIEPGIELGPDRLLRPESVQAAH
jgi:nitrate/nitrite transport system substrate-binding protein